jgi:hypothetical protein
VAAGLPAGRAVAREITRHDYDVTALVISGSDPELAGAALAALLTAAGYDGAWHRDWTDPRPAAQARRTTDQLASVFYRDRTGTIGNCARSLDGMRKGRHCR